MAEDVQGLVAEEITAVTKDNIAEFKRPADTPPAPLPRVRVGKLIVMPVFHVIDVDGDVMEEVNAQQQIIMYPKKFLEFGELVKRLEAKVNSDPAQIKQIIERPLF